MVNYEKPIIVESTCDTFETVNTASGFGSACMSIYMRGVWHPMDYQNNHRGCEGCPANWNDGVCHVAAYTSGDFRPWWEVQGLLPTF